MPPLVIREYGNERVEVSDVKTIKVELGPHPTPKPSMFVSWSFPHGGTNPRGVQQEVGGAMCTNMNTYKYREGFLAFTTQLFIKKKRGKHVRATMPCGRFLVIPMKNSKFL